jgi:hypothetical protein
MAKGKFKSLSVSEAVFNKLKEIAARRGFSTLSDTVAYLVSLEELILRRLEPVTTTSGNITSTAGNLPLTEVKQGVEPNTRTSGNVTTSSGNIDTNKANTITKCYEKSKMKYSVESNIAYFRSKGLLVDWWEEGNDKVCFELKADADSGAGQHHKKYYNKRDEGEDNSWLLQYAPNDWEEE